MERQAVLLLGNGFNIGLRDFLKTYGNQGSVNLAKSINNIINLWNKFDDLLGLVKEKLQADKKTDEITDEQVLGHIYMVLELFKIKTSLGDYFSKECISILEEQLNKEILTKLREIAYHFFDLEINDGIYKVLNRIKNSSLKDYSLRLQNNGNTLNLNIFTTNYDGIAEIIFGLGEDLFRRCPLIQKKYVCFSPGIVEDDSYLIHLHGSYKIWYLDNDFVKIRKEGFSTPEDIKSFLESENALPTIIFNAPFQKLKYIKDSFILHTYYKIFNQELLKNSILIIWGNSLKNDPHIADVIKNNFLRRKRTGRKIIIIDIQAESIIKLLNLNDNDFYFINAKEVPFEEIPRKILEIVKEMEL